MDEHLRPMCAPALRRQFPQMAPPQAPRDMPPLHHEEDEDRQRWFETQGMVRPGLAKGLDLSDPGLVPEAAARGRSVCLGRESLAAERIASGTLVGFGAAIPTARAICLVTHPRNLNRPWVAELWDWFLDQDRPADQSDTVTPSIVCNVP
ncbi:MAG: hypothetical protein IPF96_20425 [Rhodobacter sp.]|nr:hypothetical protein [Rhodobacter sp.]